VRLLENRSRQHSRGKGRQPLEGGKGKDPRIYKGRKIARRNEKRPGRAYWIKKKKEGGALLHGKRGTIADSLENGRK